MARYTPASERPPQLRGRDLRHEDDHRHEMAQRRRRTPVGAAWSYDIGAFTLIARVIDKVTNLTYERAAAHVPIDK